GTEQLVRDPKFNYYSPDPGTECVKPEIKVGDDGSEVAKGAFEAFQQTSFA
ncbi:MAG: hypothetical protein GX900_04330, partial [Clostridiaceae bacterium]|nr:hypothetical protein [Clostridiaceae bacterium]